MRVYRVVLLLLVCFALSANAATFTVTNTNDLGLGSLRQAITDANANGGADTIAFNIAAAGVQTISITSTLPTISDITTIDGYTQTGAQPNTLVVGTDAVILIEITTLNNVNSGLVFTNGASGSIVRGIAINRFETGITLNNADNMLIEGNYVGTDATGLLDRGNGNSGLFILSGSSSNTVGGNTPGARNVISGNLVGVNLGNDTTIKNSVIGNYIGPNATGTANVPGTQGISINSNGPNTIGGPGTMGNFICGQSGAGIVVDNPSTGIEILGNSIGVAPNGASMGNNIGIQFFDGFSGAPSNITIGESGAENIIANSTTDGVQLVRFNTFYPAGIRIQYNSIFNNGNLGIDHGNDGVTANDVIDGDIGFNNLQNFPVITSATAFGGNLTMNGTLNSKPSTTYVIEFFRNASCDASGNGEGESFIGETTVTTDASGNAAFNASYPAAFVSGVITALAIDDLSNDTSEFSACATIVVPLAPGVGINDVSIVEGNAGTSSLNFTITLTAPAPAGGITVDYGTANNTATLVDNDYVTNSGTATFLQGQTQQTLSITINGDVNVEPDETFFVNLTNPNNATIDDAQGVGTIKADDGLPVLTIGDIGIAEGNAGTTNLIFTVTATPNAAFDATVQYSTADVTASSATDYSASAGTVTILTGTGSQTFIVPISGDLTTEPNETFTVNLFNATNATIGDGSAIGTITNDDAQPTVTVNDPSVLEGNAGTASLNWTLTLSNPSSVVISVPFSIVAGTATVAVDYTTNSGSATFTPGNVSTTVGVSVIGDTGIEPDETIFFNLTSATNATISDSQGIGTILNDDFATPSATIGDISQAEGNSGTSTMTFNVTLSPAPGVGGTISYGTAPNTATAGTDYVTTSGTANFIAGQVTVPINVTINDDGVLEPDETFFVSLTGATGAVIADNQAIGTITNNDLAPNLAMTKTAPATVNAGSNFAYTLAIVNSGGDATGVVVTDALPAQMTVLNATPTQGSCSGTTTITCNLGTILAGDNASVAINVTASNTPGSTTNSASVLATQIDSTPADNTDTADVMIAAVAGAASAIPTLSEWGLIAMLMALAAAAIVKVR